MVATRLVRWLALGLGAWLLAAFVVLMAVRACYPYELEWLEGAMMILVERVRSGQPLYAEPTLEYTMHVYAPLYYWAAAGLSAVLGEGPLAPRLVSILASLGTLWLIRDFVRRSGGGRAPAFAAMCLYAATFDAGDAYHDTVRVDALFVFLLLLTMHGLRFWGGMRGALLAGLVCALSFAAKQSSMLVPVPMFFAVWWARSLREAVGFVVAAALPVALELVVLDACTDGWSSWFLLGQLTGHEVEQNMIRGFWTRDIAKVVGVAFVAALWYGIGLLRVRDRGAVLLGAAAVTMIGIAYASRLHKGGAENVVYPAWAAIAILAGLALDRARGERTRLVAYTLCAVQFGWLVARGDLARRLPQASDRETGAELVAALGELDGPVLVPYHGWLAEQAGKTAGGHPVAINDVLRSNDAPVVAAFREQVRERLASGYYRRIVMDDTVNDPWLEATVREYYRPLGTLLGEGRGYRWLNMRVGVEILVFGPR